MAAAAPVLRLVAWLAAGLAATTGFRTAAAAEVQAGAHRVVLQGMGMQGGGAQAGGTQGGGAQAGGTQGGVATPRPVVLLVPEAYFSGSAQAGVPAFLQVRVSVPGFGAAPAASGQCGGGLCADEVGLTVQIVPGAPPPLGAGSLRAQMEARARGGPTGITIEDAPVPPGFQEALRVRRPSPPGRDYMGVNATMLVYEDAAGRRQVGQCAMVREPVTCSFRVFDAGSQLGITYALPLPLLGERQAVEDGVRRLVAGWIER